ncbi:MAG: hypothetical protein ABSH41_22155 [Syntrophobacteraceae bacterium]|jgi:hypothetical protein
MLNENLIDPRVDFPDAMLSYSASSVQSFLRTMLTYFNVVNYATCVPPAAGEQNSPLRVNQIQPLFLSFKTQTPLAFAPDAIGHPDARCAAEHCSTPFRTSPRCKRFFARADSSLQELSLAWIL